MSLLFPLKTKKFKFRDREVTVRELTAGERSEVAKKIGEDKFLSTGLVAVLGCIDPKISEEHVQGESAEAIGKIASEIMILSGMKEADDDNVEGKPKNG